MTHRTSLLEFVEDELLRAPLTFDQVIDAVHEHWRQTLSVQGRQGNDAAHVLQLRRAELVDVAVQSLQAQVQAELSQQPPAGARSRVGADAGGRTGATATPAAPRLELSLIDEDAVAADIEISRAVEAIKAQAEFELRELQSFTSAMVGDVNVARDTNPFRPEAYVRALWEGVRTLPLSLAIQSAFLRDAADKLARTLRQGYAAACSRLEEQGVEPAAHRTIVYGSTSWAGGSIFSPDTLGELRDSLAVPLDGSPAAEATGGAGTAGQPGAASPAGTARRVDRPAIELLSRLFDAIQSDAELTPQSLALLLRLQPTALRVTMRDPALLDSYDHPVWRFMDQLTFMIETASPALTERCLRFARELVNHLVADATEQPAERFEWALERLSAFERHAFERKVHAADAEIAQLLADDSAAPGTTLEALDIGTLDTVPSKLLPAENLALPPVRPLALRPGDRVRAYLHGDWRSLQLLWVSASGQSWLLQDTASGEYRALRLRAIERLAAERLAMPLRPRSLVRGAAERVLRSIDPAPRTR